MNTYAKTAAADKATSSPQTKSRKHDDLGSALYPMDSRPAAGQLRQLQEMADTGQQARPLLQTKTLACAYSALQLQAVQLKGGSHGKKKLLNVQGTYTVGGVATAFNDRGENISIVKGHGAYEDEGALAENWVRTAYRLQPADTITITAYNFFTRK